VLQVGDVETLYIFRFLQGVLVGNFMTLVPTYIGELVPKEYGSKFGVYPQISVVLGVLVSFLLGMIFTDSFGMLNYTQPDQLQNWQR
jgi:MFS family permease